MQPIVADRSGFSRYISAITIADRSGLGGLAGEIGALKAQPHALVEGTAGYHAHLVLSWSASFISVRADPPDHPGTLLTGNPAYSNPHLH